MEPGDADEIRQKRTRNFPGVAQVRIIAGRFRGRTLDAPRRPFDAADR
jgi:hypothetical protein